MALHVMDEANRCLQCKVPQCQKGCPINTNIPMAIRLLKENKLNEAGKMLFENNPLTTVCSLICNHENQCEGHCVLGRKGAPVHFSTIENYISSTYANQMTEGPKPSNGMRVAIIGSGPAGITIAIILARYGYQVTIFEGKDKIGGVLRYGIPEFRLPKTVLDDIEYRHLALKGIKLVLTPLSVVPSELMICSVTATNLYSLVRVYGSLTLFILKERLSVMSTLVSITSITLTATISAKLLLLSVPVMLLWTLQELPRERALAMSSVSLSLRKLLQANMNSAMHSLKESHLNITNALLRLKMTVVIFRDIIENEDGTFTDVEGTDTLHHSDSVIISISQGPQNRIVNTTTGLKATARGLLDADETGHTSRPVYLHQVMLSTVQEPW